MSQFLLNLQYCKRKLWTDNNTLLYKTQKVRTKAPLSLHILEVLEYGAVDTDCLLVFVLPNNKRSDVFKWTSTLCTRVNIKNIHSGRSRWPRGLKRSPAVNFMLGLWVRISPGYGCLSIVNVACCTGRGQCDEPIPPSRESYPMSVCCWELSSAEITLYTSNA
jgi:hypothetical protein